MAGLARLLKLGNEIVVLMDITSALTSKCDIVAFRMLCMLRVPFAILCNWRVAACSIAMVQV